MTGDVTIEGDVQPCKMRWRTYQQHTQQAQWQRACKRPEQYQKEVSLVMGVCQAGCWVGLLQHAAGYAHQTKP